MHKHRLPKCTKQLASAWQQPISTWFKHQSTPVVTAHRALKAWTFSDTEPLQGECMEAAPQRLARLAQGMRPMPRLTMPWVHAPVPVRCGAVPQATLCLRGRCAPPAPQEEAQAVAPWVGAGEAWQRPARAALKGQSKGHQQRL